MASWDERWGGGVAEVNGDGQVCGGGGGGEDDEGRWRWEGWGVQDY